MRDTVRDLKKKRFPGCAVALLVAPFGAPAGARINYIGNGQRDDMRVMMKEVVARWEGTGHAGTETRQ
jgi:hypothetical protein